MINISDLQITNNSNQITNQPIDFGTVLNSVKDMWQLNSNQINVVARSTKMLNSKYGLLNAIPIVCKNDKCPYIDTCTIPISDRQLGGRCQQEIAAIISRFENLCREFEITENDSVDLGQIKEIVDLEIMILRCDSRVASSADVLHESIANITKTGKPLYEWKVDPAIELKLELIEKHSKILKDLNGTRSSKKENNVTLDPSQQAAELMKKAKEIEDKIIKMNVTVVDSEYTDVKEIKNDCEEDNTSVEVNDDELSEMYKELDSVVCKEGE